MIEESGIRISLFNNKKLIRFFNKSNKEIYYLCGDDSNFTSDEIEIYNGIYSIVIARKIWKSLVRIGYMSVEFDDDNKMKHLNKEKV